MEPMPDDSFQEPGEPFASYQNELCKYLLSLLNTLHPLTRIDALVALQQKGKLLASSELQTPNSSVPHGSWSLAVLLVALQVSPAVDPRIANTVAVALNVSTALLALSQHALLSLSTYGAPSALVFRLLEAFQQAALTATGGQHKDLLAEQRPVSDITTEECITIAAEKAGALLRLACDAGAICAGADKEECELFSALGEFLGIAHQLDNDSHDLYHILQGESSQLYLDTKPVVKSVKTDLIRQKKTLPVVLAARSRSTLQKPLPLDDSGQWEAIYDSLREGMIATWGISLLYKERARESLQKIEARRPVSYLLRLLLGFT